jgi:hypothetical protein
LVKAASVMGVQHVSACLRDRVVVARVTILRSY